MDSLALSNYMAIARWLTGRVDRTISQLPGSESTATFPGQEPANGLPWYWVFYPYLDAPEKQQESALHAGYVKVVNKDEADAVIAKLEKKLDLYKRGFKEDDRINAYLYAELRHHKFKRCLDKAELCRLEQNRIELIENQDITDDDFDKLVKGFYKKWRERWLKIAEKFKEHR